MLFAEALGLRMQRRTVEAGHFQIHLVLARILFAVRFKHVLHQRTFRCSFAAETRPEFVLDQYGFVFVGRLDISRNTLL